MKIVFFNFITFFFGLVFLELVFGSWIKKTNKGSLLIPKNQINIIDNFPYKSEQIGIYSRDENGFRANVYDLSEVDILIMGGSTTEEREVDDSFIWTKFFEKNLNHNFKVLNAGIGGQTSYGHHLMFDLWFSDLEELNPKYILIYIGINDALNLLESMNYNFFEQEGRVINNKNKDLLKYVKNSDRIIQYIKNNSILHQLYLIIRGNLLSRKYKVSYNQNITFHTPHVIVKPGNATLDKKMLSSFETFYFKNLFSIYKKGNIYNAEIILITQGVASDHWITPYLKKVNSLTLKYCRENKKICFNLSKYINNFSERNNLFYDGIHTSPTGSDYIGRKIAALFNEYYDND